MQTITQHPSPASVAIGPSLADRLKRDIGLHRAAQTLADATRCQMGLSPAPLSQLDPRDREWFRQTSRHLIEIFETITTEREPDAQREAREMQAVRDIRLIESRFAKARALATAKSEERGHTLGPWERTAAEQEGEASVRAQCVSCGRTVFINIACDPAFFGMAILAGCLVAAEPGR